MGYWEAISGGVRMNPHPVPRSHMSFDCRVGPQSLFPVQRVAIIVASREATKSFFFVPLYRNGRKNAGEKRKIRKYEKNLPTRSRVTRPVDRKQDYF